MSALAELFPDEDYRFHLTLRRGETAAFFAPGPDAGRILAERREWLATDPARYAACQREGAPLVEDWANVVRGWGWGQGRDCATLGGELEPDFLLLSPDSTGHFRLRAGALVFPTSWALEDKLGRTMDEIHGVVPGLNPTLGASIGQFLARLKPGGPAFLRSNWGLAATAALNLHPSQPRPTLNPDRVPGQVWLRIEYQLLAALPAGGGIVFGIRIALHPLAEVLRDPDTRRGFARALRTMPDELAAYKGLAAVRETLVRLAVREDPLRE